MDLHQPSSLAPDCDFELPKVVAGSIELPADDAGNATPPPAVVGEPLAALEARNSWRKREEVALNALEKRITELWGHINAATAQFLALLAEFDRRKGWAQHGVMSCAHWLNWQCGIGEVAAREKLRVARALESLPKIRAAFGEGRLSYSKVRGITRVAVAETEDYWLHIGLNGTAAHVERTVRGYRRVVRYLERDEAEAVHERRYLDCRREADGSVRLDARLSPEVGEMLLKALEAAHAELEARDGDAESGEAGKDDTDPADADAVPENVSAETSKAQAARWHRLCEVPDDVSAETPPRSVGQRRADALAHVLERFLAGKRSVSAASAHEVVVHIAHDALRDVPESSGAEFDSGRSVAVETARRLGCDGALVGVVEGTKGEPLAVGRRTRAVPPAIRRALRVRDGGCRFPGCGRSRYAHAHHIKHWADGGETKLDNLVTLCSQHHRQVHEGGYGVRMNEGEIEFTRPDGSVIPPAGLPHGKCFRGNISAASGLQRLAAFNAACGLAIDAQTARCDWNGERMDYDIAIDNLCWKAGFR